MINIMAISAAIVNDATAIDTAVVDDATAVDTTIVIEIKVQVEIDEDIDVFFLLFYDNILSIYQF